MHSLPLTTDAKRLGVEARGAASDTTGRADWRASDAETERQLALAKAGAGYLLRSNLCICLHCLVGYCNGLPVLAEALCREIGEQGGIQPILIPHEDNGRRYTPYRTDRRQTQV